MPLTKEKLIDIFDTAIKLQSKFVFVGVDAAGTKEIIAIPRESFGKKLAYYNNAYTDDLTLKTAECVRIFGITYGELAAINHLI